MCILHHHYTNATADKFSTNLSAMATKHQQIVNLLFFGDFEA